VANAQAPDAHAAGAHESGETRRDFIYIAAGAAGAVGAGATAWAFIDQMNPAADTRALSTTDVDLSAIELGQQIKVMWQGKPVFVRHRTPTEIDSARRDDYASLKDPQLDAERLVQEDGEAGRPEWLILLASCTHLGCVPTFVEGSSYGGWFCPCHGSDYDTSGRIRSGPAPKNLEVAPYLFTGETAIRIG
jgi:ubiquinol-cytochrome c reductase iron-sulfur subunit